MKAYKLYAGVLLVCLALGIHPGQPDSAHADIFDELEDDTGGDLFDELEDSTGPGMTGDEPSAEELAEFEQWRNQNLAEYDDYKEQLLKEFEEYKRIVQEETDKYRNELSKTWQDPKLSSQTVWVDYSDDLQQRNSVDFENEVITIETADGDSGSSDEALRETLTELVTKNKAEAFEEDVIARNVEERSKLEIEHLVTADVKPAPIIVSYLTGLAMASAEEVQEIVDYMLDNRKEVTVTDDQGRQIQKTEVPLSAPPQVVEKPVAPAPTARNTAQLPNKAQGISAYVSSYSARDELDPAVVYAVIETESAFNPMAKSPIPAYGLMQIVPESAGMDATKQLFGQEKILSSSYLYNSEQNIEIGTTYLNILYYRYLRKISDPVSRLYCSIAAYNTGAGNVARAFTGNKKLSTAIPLINALEPDEVYEKLRTDLPYEETRRYIVKVNDRIKKYEGLGF